MIIYLGTRPALPDSLDLDNSYKKVLEVKFCNTFITFSNDYCKNA